MDEIKVGQKVTYVTKFKREKGIVKNIQNDKYAFIVYNCGGNWKDYEKYTGARTKINHLIKGWDEEWI